jgi:hypothetical protein
MTVTSTNSNSNVQAYLQSLLQAGSTNGSSASTDPLTSLMNSFYPNSPTGQASVSPPPQPPVSGASGPGFSPDTMSAMLSTQEQGSATRAQQLFAKMDADGDGKVSQTEFENVFGSGADKTKVDGLFNALDSNSDGNVSSDEFKSAVQSAQAQRGHHHRHHAKSSDEGDPLQQLMSGTSVTGAKATTTTAPDGSTTTTIKYADGSTVSSTTPASSASDTGSQNANSGGNRAAVNLLEQLIKTQGQFLSRLSTPASSLLATV